MAPELPKTIEPAADMLTVADFSLVADKFYEGLLYDDELFRAYTSYKAAYTKYVGGELTVPIGTRDIDEWLFNLVAATTLPVQKRRLASVVRFAAGGPSMEGTLHG